MVSIADSGPLNYLIQIGLIDELPACFGTVLIPGAVFAELSHPSSKPAVRQWVTSLSSWCQVVKLKPDNRLIGRHAGEREVVLLFYEREFGIDYVLIDDASGRAILRTHGTVAIIGTIGVLVALCRGKPNPRNVLEESLKRLRQTNFYFSSRLNASIALLLESL